MAAFFMRWQQRLEPHALRSPGTKRIGTALRVGLGRVTSWLLVLALGASVTTGFAHADTIEVREARLEAQDEGWTLRTEFGLELTSRLEEAVNRGVPLYFNLEFELIRPRWYWLDEKTVQAGQTYKLSYHALTQSYRLSAGSLYQSFATLKEALRLLARPRLFAIEKQKVVPGESYTAQVRMRLDAAQLPKAFQINTLTSREWTLESDWKKFLFRADSPMPGGPADLPTGAITGAPPGGGQK
jgi:hypothetical protein